MTWFWLGVTVLFAGVVVWLDVSGRRAARAPREVESFPRPFPAVRVLRVVPEERPYDWERDGE